METRASSSMNVAPVVLLVFPGSFCGSLIMQKIVKSRTQERAAMREMGLGELASHSLLRVPVLFNARCVFVAVAFWSATLLFCAWKVAQMCAIKIALILASWTLFPIGARAASSGGLQSHKLELHMFVWMLFYGAYMFPRLAYPISVLIYLSLGGEF
jgi:hypothetical protein